MSERARVLTVGAFGAAAGVSVETIRFYQRKGLLRVPRRSYGTIRQYDDSDLARLKFVKSAQQLGFSLDEVGSLLELQDGANCSEARVVAEQKLDDVRMKLRDLRRIESALTGLVSACAKSRGTVSCPLIAALYEPYQVKPDGEDERQGEIASAASRR